MLNKLRWNELLLVRSSILGLFVNTLTFNGKFSLHNKEKFPQEIEMQLSQKENTFSQLFIAFLKSTSNSEYFEKKGESHSLSISEIINCKRRGYSNVYKSCFRTPFGSQHVRAS